MRGRAAIPGSLFSLGGLLAALLAGGCATKPGNRGMAPMPGPAAPQARHAPIDHDLPALPAAGSGRGGYYQDDGPGDSPPEGLRDVPDAVVRAEPYSRYANRPYVVFGKSYTPMVDEQPFVQRGVSSWYGKKFHGQKTSSGELYDMYKMTAAHPTLPIPSFARVTSVDSGKTVVVRINDRGPFHSSRIIDVSYTAALKLGLLSKGSHEVEVERLLPGAADRIASVRRNAPLPQAASVAPEIAALMLEDRAPELDAPPQATPTPGFYLQLGAYSLASKAEQIRARLMDAGSVPAALEVVKAGAVHRLLSGPFDSRVEALRAAGDLPAALGLKPIVIKR